MTPLSIEITPSPEPVMYRQLMANSQNGCRESYSKLLTHFDQVLRTWLTVPEDRDQRAAERLIEDILRAAHRKLETADPAQPILPWLLSIAQFRAQVRSRRHAPAGAPLTDLICARTKRALPHYPLKKAA